MHAHRRKIAKLKILCLALAYLLLQLGGAWHVAQREHARCAEHGEWIDVAHANTASQSHPDQGPVAIAGGASQEHDHCVIVEAARVRAVAHAGAPVELWHEVLATSAPPRAAEPADPGFDRYLLAPKQSPPC